MKPKLHLAFFIALFFSVTNSYGQLTSIFNKKDDSTAFVKMPIIGFGVLAHKTTYMQEIPIRPITGGFSYGGGDNWVGIGYGINIDYRFHKYFAFHFDGTHYKLKAPIAFSGQESILLTRFVYDNTGYPTSNMRVGPFEEDYNYHRNTTALRFGLKGYFLNKKSFDLWYGAYYSVFAWSINMLNEEKNKTLGNTSGTVSYYGLFNIGIDLWDKNRSSGVTIFFESGGAPLTGDYTIEDCIITGWNFNDGGTHVMGTYRLGVFVNFSVKKKQD